MFRLGKIDYLNLLPFDVFIKKSHLSTQIKQMISHRQSYPAKLNKDFLFGRIDGGFVSSISAFKARKIATNVGIIAKGEVWSVLCLPKTQKDDYQSATSNALKKVLGLNGEVLIGDRALRYKLQGGVGEDLGALWWQKTKCPFVFGLLCARGQYHTIKQLGEKFTHSNVKIPYYLLKQKSDQTQVLPKDILRYLQKIHYKLGIKEKNGLERFYRQLLFLGIKPPRRFERGSKRSL